MFLMPLKLNDFDLELVVASPICKIKVTQDSLNSFLTVTGAVQPRKNWCGSSSCTSYNMKLCQGNFVVLANQGQPLQSLLPPGNFSKFNTFFN